MKLEVKLFAVARQLVGAETAAVELSDSATVAELREALAAQYPPLSNLLARMLVAVDTEYAADQTPLRAGQEVALIPPVSGG